MSKLTFKPQSEFGIASSDYNVYSNGKLVGYTETNKEDWRKTFSPVFEWQHHFSPGLIKRLGLIAK